MRKLILSLLIVGIAILVISQTSYAFPTSGVANYSTIYWTATVNWEVYAPTVAAHGLSGDSDWHYFYYITCTEDDLDGDSAKTPITFFSVGNPQLAPINLYGSIDNGAGSPAPDSAAPTTANALYATFITDGIDKAESSDWLYYTSPWEPGWVIGGLQNGGPNDNQPLPGPVIPEPASVALLGMGLFGLAGGVFKKRFRA